MCHHSPRRKSVPVQLLLAPISPLSKSFWYTTIAEAVDASEQEKASASAESPANLLISITSSSPESQVQIDVMIIIETRRSSRIAQMRHNANKKADDLR